MSEKGFFSTPKILVWTGDGRNIETAQAFHFTRPNGEIVEFPMGSTSDGPSEPPPLMGVIHNYGPVWLPAVGHDILYRTSGRPKAECDTIFLEMMEANGVGEIEAVTFYEAVKLGGGGAFEGDRKNQGGAK